LSRRSPLDIAGRTAIVVDDGIATGATMRVALHAIRKRNPARLVLATPVAAAETLDQLRPMADEVVCEKAPVGLGAIGFYYIDFHQMEDDEVTEILACAAPPEKKPPVAGRSNKGTKSEPPPQG
jgi:predicted phosphoribosyltransferase